MTTIEFFPVDWIEGDVDEERPWYRIVAFGKTRDAQSVCVHVRFTPYFFVELPAEWSEARGKLFVTETARAHDGLPGKCMLVKRKSAWGFTNGRARLMAQLAFETRAAARRARTALSKKHQTYEASVEPLVRFFHLRNVSPAGWIRATACAPASSPIATADIEVETTFDRVFPGELTCQPPLVIASWDIETYSESGKFPLPENPNDKIIQISTTYRVYGQPEPYKRTVSCLSATDPVEGAEIAWFEHEHDVVNHWISGLRKEKTDVLIGYNTHQFDWKYVYGRSLMCVDDSTGDELVFLDGLGNLARGGGKTVERELNSSAYGQNKFFYLSTPGIMQLDLLQWFRKNRSMDSYTLDNVSKTFLGRQKLDLPAAEIFEKFRGTSADRAEIARYAIRDTELPLELLEKMAIFEDLTEMANAVKVPVDYINNRGQQIRVFSSLVGKARSMGYVIPDDKAISTDGKFEGATVLDAKKGAYFEPIAALDFASLYPSIIRAENMSFDTLVLDPKYANVPGVEYYSVDTGLGTFRFAQPGPDDRFKGVLPCLLDDLAKFRKQAKRDMAAAKARGDAWSATLFNAKQLAYKVTMNSAYGFCGASKGFLPCVPIAASVTATGRNMIAKTAQLAVELVPGSEVVYGDTDSVMVKFNVAPDLGTQFEIASDVAKRISETFKPPHELEMEKIYLPYVLYSKKRYAAIKYEDPSDEGKMDVKGIALVRRDNCPLVKDVLGECLDALLFRRDARFALDVARQHIRRVLDNEHPMAKFVVSKTLRTGYKVDAQPHVFVARKIHQRRGFPVSSGTRVPYVFVENKDDPNQKQAEKAEDYEYALSKNLTVDRLYYIDHQLRKPLIGLFEPVSNDPDEEIFGHETVREKLGALTASRLEDVKTAKRIQKNKANRQMEITNFFVRSGV